MRLRPPPRSAEAPKIYRARDPLRYVALAIIAFLGLFAGYTLLTNPAFEWDVVGDYLLSAPILKGVVVTLEISLAGMILGSIGGLFVAYMRLSAYFPFRAAAAAYVWAFRGTPILVQIIFWYNFAAIFPTLSIGVPFGGPKLYTVNTNEFLSVTATIIIALTTYTTAYMAEIIRGGILSVPEGQWLAASSLGMSRTRTLLTVITPQAMLPIVPPAVNEYLTLMKGTSLASVIGVFELFYTAQTIYNRTYQVVPLLIVACLWYLALTSVMSVGQSYLERRVDASRRSTRPARGRPGKVSNVLVEGG